ncbi:MULTISPECIES: hypothetical protein [Ralstonia solanacearum species complex]|uniref:hypothetical protein n=1 Tax=Ralstonia solanacearum species complex TaxID=3116862 RepID=UPI001268D948|nr:hypothetical protein [Ralstonia pseudosolanacearum]MCK4125576.1 hypothetical protein [Ralstonia pseudosolanacearum]MDO3559730.1 hypothetical protein [Ralstonia pseudosolanacearum]MDO3579389.1 hypothetical protein [Ralstonia pseudosolanacearum]MDO3589299.1 hypothetical protein [Ralstonia pseudosolanacearum]
MSAKDKNTVNSVVRRIVIKVVDQASAQERAALLAWAKQMIAIRDSDEGAQEKIRQAVGLTHGSTAIIPFVSTLGKEIKRLGWDERSWAVRLGLSTAMATAALFGGEGAGVAVFGGAIGVPLWILFGTGGVAAGALIEEVNKRR